MRVKPLRAAAVVDDARRLPFAVILRNLRQHPARQSQHRSRTFQSLLNYVAIPTDPVTLWRLLAVDRNPSAHYTAVRHHDLRNVDIRRAVAILVEVQHIRLDFRVSGSADTRTKRRYPPLNPASTPAKRGRTEIEVAQSFRPRQVPWLRHVAKTHQRDLDAAPRQPRDQFAGVGPYAANRVRGDEYSQHLCRQPVSRQFVHHLRRLVLGALRPQPLHQFGNVILKAVARRVTQHTMRGRNVRKTMADIARPDTCR